MPATRRPACTFNHATRDVNGLNQTGPGGSNESPWIREDVTLPMSDASRPVGKHADAFSSWTPPRDAWATSATGRSTTSRDGCSNGTNRWQRIGAGLAAILVQVALLLSVMVERVGSPTVSAPGLAGTTTLQLRFMETRLPGQRHPGTASYRDTAVARVPGPLAKPLVARDMAGPSLPPPSPGVAREAISTGEEASFLSNHGDFGPADRPSDSRRASDYRGALPKADANVMTHDTGGIAYRATRFESSWAPDRENAVSKAIDRATLHAAARLAQGVEVDCAGGTSSPGPTGTTVPTLAIASARCHGTPPPAPVAAQAVLDIQMLAPALPLVDRTRPLASPRSTTGNAAGCATGAFRTGHCSAPGGADDAPGANGSLLPPGTPADPRH